MNSLDLFLSIASDLAVAQTAGERYRRLLEALGRTIPFDAAALMRVHDNELSIVAARGLKPDAGERRFRIVDHPRLETVCRSDGPVLFPAGSTLPDPFDGLLASDPEIVTGIHACLGCPLRVRDRMIGVLTADAISPSAFNDINPQLIRAVAILAAAEMHTTELIEALERTARRQGLIAHDLMMDARRRLGSRIVGTSPLLENLRREIDVVAWSDFPVLVTGETGVGKELVAHAIHAGSRRRDEPLLYVNCAALPESLVDSELFGHVKGAFTGAAADRPGKFEVADGGTLFLDEVGELPLAAQPKLLRALQHGDIQRVGADRTVRVDVRIVAATNRDLPREIESGRFRADLFHRLNVYPIRVPALRHHPEDIPLLAGHFCDMIGRRLGLPPIRLEHAAQAALAGYDWPGNVRELENLLARAILKASAEQPGQARIGLARSHLGMEFDRSGGGREAPETEPIGPPPDGLTFRQAVGRYQRGLILAAIQQSGGNWAAAARSLGLHRSNLHHLADRLGLRPAGATVVLGKKP